MKELLQEPYFANQEVYWPFENLMLMVEKRKLKRHFPKGGS